MVYHHSISALTSRSDAAMLKCWDLLTSLVSKLFCVLAGGNMKSNVTTTTQKKYPFWVITFSMMPMSTIALHYKCT